MTQLKRVLILEENLDHLELLTMLLESNFTPIDIHTVETIEDCLEFLEQTEYDLIMTGCFIRNVCITERLSYIVERAHGAPIIVITGSGDENIAAEVIKLGANEYVVKTRKSLERLPTIIAKYFKRGRKHIKQAERLGTKADSDLLLREVDRLIQKARTVTAKAVSSPLQGDMNSLEALFNQIQHLRELASKILPK